MGLTGRNFSLFYASWFCDGRSLVLPEAKNVGNIIMKNFMDFSVGSLMFWIIGYSIMYGGDGAFFGAFDFFYNDGTDLHNLFFQTVFAATAATIVSGAMAERTKFSTYLLFSLIITVVIYPISGHWVWGRWLVKRVRLPRFCRFNSCTLSWRMGCLSRRLDHWATYWQIQRNNQCHPWA